MFNELVTTIISSSASEFLTAKAKKEIKKWDSVNSSHCMAKGRVPAPPAPQRNNFLLALNSTRNLSHESLRKEY
jgi:hypothetical protein